MSKAVIIINTNGSIRIEGDFEIRDQHGSPYGLGGRERVSLCRCGLSKTKPFCDGSHKGIFLDDTQAYDLPPLKKN